MKNSSDGYPKPPSLEKESPLRDFRRIAELNEEKTLFTYAAFSKEHARYFGLEKDHRLAYKRDVDRIVHSRAYARYVDKTQVVYLVDNDHVTHRGLHVQLVSNFSRGVAEILRLNLDLVEAIALGHDVGHPPFGHEGEGYLSELSQEFGNGFFAHPHQSCRVFMETEPLNLGLAVYDGFLCHDGGMQGACIEPKFGKTWDDHFRERREKLEDPEMNIIPGTLEGCLVKLCDTISYLGKDIEDAITLGIISRDQVPQTHLGNTNSQILTTLAQDMIYNSYDKPYISISDQSYDALKQIRVFNFENIYSHPKLKTESLKVKWAYRQLFKRLLTEYQEVGKESFIWKNFLDNKNEKYLKETTSTVMVIDYISGMTNNYFYRVFQEIFIPSRIQLSSLC